MKKFKANDNKSEEHEINYRQFNKKLELLNQILSLISERSEGLYSCIASIHRRIYRCRQSIYF